MFVFQGIIYFFLLYELYKVANQLDKAEGSALFNKILVFAIGNWIVALLLGTLIWILIERGIKKKYQQVLLDAKRMAQGDLKIVKEYTEEGDEFSQLAKEMNETRKNLNKMITHIMYVSNQVLNKSTALSGAADDITASSQQISSAMDELAKGSEEQANTANNLYVKMQAFLDTITNVVLKTEETKSISEKMVEKTSEGEQMMNQSLERMTIINTNISQSLYMLDELNSKIKNVNKLIVVIKNIAEQTNLLALNASIEAARAGEHGKGFAVVAQEVRKLAEGVNASVKDINEILKDIQEESQKVLESLGEGFQLVDEGTVQMYATGETIKSILDLIGETGDRIQSMANSLYSALDDSQMVGNYIENVASISEQSAANIEETAASVQEANASLEQIHHSAVELEKEAEKLKNLVSQFEI